MAERDAAIARLYVGRPDLTLKVIGGRYGVSAQSVNRVARARKCARRIQRPGWRRFRCAHCRRWRVVRAHRRAKYCSRSCSVQAQPHPGYGLLYMLRRLRQKAVELGREPVQADLKADRSLPAVNTYIKHFGSWNAAKLAALHEPFRIGSQGVEGEGNSAPHSEPVHRSRVTHGMAMESGPKTASVKSPAGPRRTPLRSRGGSPVPSGGSGYTRLPAGFHFSQQEHAL